ncbi:MAG: hypothetical protein RLZZ628_2473 [Bacteroidota bacterium]|jgi:hypothetical protein
MFKNSNLEKDFPFLIREAEQLHPNDPNRAAFLRIAKDLFLLDKQDTLAFLETIQDAKMLFYAISSGCWVRFPSKTFVAAFKIQIDRFKDAGNYEHLMLHYKDAVKYLEDLEIDKINTRAYQAELKKAKQ